MAKRALITGITGQDGSYLAELLLDKGYEVIGMVRRSSTVNFERIGHLQDRIDARARRPARRGVADRGAAHAPPDEVYNLAAQSFVQTSFGQPVLTGETTALGVTRLLDAIRIVDPDIRFYQASSSEMFGKVVEVPQTESTPFYPAALRRGQGLRPLDHGQLPRELRPARVERHPVQPRIAAPRPRVRDRKITHGVARIKLGLDTELRLGNLEAQRDWGFAGDYVEAMWLMLQQDEPGRLRGRRPARPTRCASSARWRSATSGSTGRTTSSWTSSFFRPAEVDLLVGDPAKAARRCSAGSPRRRSRSWCR